MYQPNSCGAIVPIIFPRGVLLGILGGGMLHGSPNPDPISDPKISFSTPVFRPGGGYKTQYYMFT